MIVTTLISSLPYALLICGWVFLLIFQIAPEKEKKHDFDNKKIWAISSISCFALSFITLIATTI